MMIKLAFIVCLVASTLFGSDNSFPRSVNFYDRPVKAKLYVARHNASLGNPTIELEDGALWTKTRLTESNTSEIWTRITYKRESGILGVPFIHRKCVQTFRLEKHTDNSSKNPKLTSEEKVRPHYVGLGVMATLLAGSCYLWQLFNK